MAPLRNRLQLDAELILTAGEASSGAAEIEKYFGFVGALGQDASSTNDDPVLTKL